MSHSNNCGTYIMPLIERTWISVILETGVMVAAHREMCVAALWSENVSITRKNLLPTLLTNVEKGICKKNTNADRRRVISCLETKSYIGPTFSLFHTTGKMSVTLLYVVWLGDLSFMNSSSVIFKLCHQFFLIPSFQFVSGFMSCGCIVLFIMSRFLLATVMSVWCALSLCPCFCVHVKYHLTASKFVPG
jgi:hypothetical protein